MSHLYRLSRALGGRHGAKVLQRNVCAHGNILGVQLARVSRNFQSEHRKPDPPGGMGGKGFSPFDFTQQNVGLPLRDIIETKNKHIQAINPNHHLMMFPFNYTFLNRAFSPATQFSPFRALHVPFYKAFFDRAFNEHEFLEGAKEAFKVLRPVLIKRGSQRILQSIQNADVDADIPEVSTEQMDNADEMDQFIKEVTTDAMYAAIQDYYRTLASDDLYLAGGELKITHASIRKICTKRPEGAPLGAFSTAIEVHIAAKEDIHMLNHKGKIVLGSEDTRLKLSSWVFERSYGESDWRLATCVF